MRFISRSGNFDKTTCHRDSSVFTLDGVFRRRDIQHSAADDNGIIGMDSIFHCRRYRDIASATQTYVFVTDYRMFIISGYRQRTASTEYQLSFTKETGLHIFSVSQCIRCSVGQCIGRTLRADNKYPFR